ncbi:MAG: YfiR family protein [Desulfamplus sp.]|nr:YfiR family protein [Desulfamplus sp.]
MIITIALAIYSTECGYAAEISEYQIKAAYIYNFTKFIHWPDNAFRDQTAPLVVGVLGENDFDGALIPLSSKTVNSRAIQIKFFRTLEDVQECHILYISNSDTVETDSILKELKFRPIVTIGDGEQFAFRGGVIQFVMIRSRLRFILNLANAKINQIQIDAQLLSLATEVLYDK